MTLRDWIQGNRRRLPRKLSSVEPTYVDNTSHTLIDEDLLEEVDVNANAVLLRFYARSATKRELKSKASMK